MPELNQCSSMVSAPVWREPPFRVMAGAWRSWSNPVRTPPDIAGLGGSDLDGETLGPAMPAGGNDWVRALVLRGTRGPRVTRASSSAGALVVNIWGRFDSTISWVRFAVSTFSAIRVVSRPTVLTSAMGPQPDGRARFVSRKTPRCRLVPVFRSIRSPWLISSLMLSSMTAPKIKFTSSRAASSTRLAASSISVMRVQTTRKLIKMAVAPSLISSNSGDEMAC